MSRQDDFNLERWTSTASTVNSDYYTEQRMEKIREETRLHDIRDSYKMMERPRLVLDDLKAIRTKLKESLGVEPEYLETEEEKEEKSFLFDPKELDI